MKRRAAALFALGVAGFFVILYATSLYGVGLSPDSVSYISVARQLKAGNGFSTYSGAKLISQPPLYPVILALPQVLNVDPRQTARYVDAMTFGIIVAFATYMTDRWFQRFWLTLAVGVWTLFSVPLFAVSIMAWTEPVFILLTLVFLFTMQQYLDTHHPRWLLPCSIVIGLAALTRYIGVVLIASGVLLIVFFDAQNALVTRIRRAALVGVTASAFPLAWMIRNWSINGTLLGERAPSSASLLDNLEHTDAVFFGWFLPAQSRETTIGITLILGAIGLVCLAALYWKRASLPRSNSSAVRVLIVFAATYTAGLIVSSTTTAYDQIDDRLLSPVYVPVLMLALLGAYDVQRQIPRRYQIVAIVTFVLWTLVYPVAMTGLSAHLKATQGAGGFARSEWVDSETVRFLEQNRARYVDDTIYSNQPNALYAILEISSTRAPQKYFYNSTKRVTELSSLHGTWPETVPALLVWFDEYPSHLYSVEELKTVVNLSLVTRLDDGAIYQISEQQ